MKGFSNSYYTGYFANSLSYSVEISVLISYFSIFVFSFLIFTSPFSRFRLRCWFLFFTFPFLFLAFWFSLRHFPFRLRFWFLFFTFQFLFLTFWFFLWNFSFWLKFRSLFFTLLWQACLSVYIPWASDDYFESFLLPQQRRYWGIKNDSK